MPNLIFEESLIGKMQLHGPVREQDKRGRSHSRLRHVVNLHALAHGNRGAVKINRLQEPVHLAGRDPFAALGSHLFNQRKNLVGPRSCLRGEEKHRSVAEKFEPVAQALLVQSAIMRTLGILNPRGL